MPSFTLTPQQYAVLRDELSTRNDEIADIELSTIQIILANDKVDPYLDVYLLAIVQPSDLQLYSNADLTVAKTRFEETIRTTYPPLRASQYIDDSTILQAILHEQTLRADRIY